MDVIPTFLKKIFHNKCSENNDVMYVWVLMVIKILLEAFGSQRILSQQKQELIR